MQVGFITHFINLHKKVSSPLFHLDQEHCFICIERKRIFFSIKVSYRFMKVQKGNHSTSLACCIFNFYDYSNRWSKQPTQQVECQSIRPRSTQVIKHIFVQNTRNSNLADFPFFLETNGSHFVSLYILIFIRLAIHGLPFFSQIVSASFFLLKKNNPRKSMPFGRFDPFLSVGFLSSVAMVNLHTQIEQSKLTQRVFSLLLFVSLWWAFPCLDYTFRGGGGALRNIQHESCWYTPDNMALAKQGIVAYFWQLNI